MTDLARQRKNQRARERYASSPEIRAAYKERTMRARKRRHAMFGDEEAAKRKNPATWAATTLNRLRHRAKMAGVPFSLTSEDIVVPLVCPIFGTPFVFGASPPVPESPSVDKIFPEKGMSRVMWLLSPDEPT